MYGHSSTAALQKWPDTGVSVLELSLLCPLRPTTLLLIWDEHTAWSPGVQVPCWSTAPRTLELPSVTEKQVSKSIPRCLCALIHYINRKLIDAGSQPWAPGKGLDTRTSEDTRGPARWICHCLGKVAADSREVIDPTVLTCSVTCPGLAEKHLRCGRVLESE